VWKKNSKTSPRNRGGFLKYVFILHHHEDEDYPLQSGRFLVMKNQNEKRTPLQTERIFYGKNIWDELSDYCFWEYSYSLSTFLFLTFSSMSQYLEPRKYSTPPLTEKIRVAIVWATGMVGRRFAELLSEHPYFQVEALTASSRSTWRMYVDIATERGHRVPKSLAFRQIEDLSQVTRTRVRLIFSAFEGTKDEILTTESELAKRGFMVVSNNSAHRWTPDIPMLMPEVNADHLSLLETQESWKNAEGGIVVKPNCSIQSFVPVLKAWEKFGIKDVHVVTEQSISWAGKTFEEWEEMVDNVIPHIGGEEQKTETEPLKILGQDGKPLDKAQLPISAICTRVATTDGHMANVFVEFHWAPSREELERAISEYDNPLKSLDLPSSPYKFLIYSKDLDRPQTRLDRDTGDGMSVTVGRLQQKWLQKWSFSGLSHNTLRWAAGWAVLTAELLHARWYL
jgi:aspartate-semialdehyde dehydrogenase